MSQLPLGWATTALGEIISLNYGKSLPDRVRSNDGYPVYGSNGIVGAHESPLTSGETIIVGRKGSVGAVHHSAGPCSPIDTTYYINAFHGMPVRYWYRFLSSLDLAGLNRATAIPGLNREDAYRVEIPLPPLPEQKRIADKLEAVLGRVDVCRARLARVPDLLKRFRQSVLAAATSGRLTEDWRSSTKRKKTGADVVARDADLKRKLLEREPGLAKKKSTIESEVNTEYIYEIPEGWVFSTWGNVSEWITYGFTRPMPASATGVKQVTAKDVLNFSLQIESARFTTTEAFAELSEKDKPRKGDLLITKDGTIGRAALVNSNESFCINQSVAVCWLRTTTMSKRYLEIVVNADFTQRFIADHAQGMAIQHLSIADFSHCPLPVPSLEEQHEIARRVDILFKLADRIEARLSEAQTTIDRLTPSTLAKAFRGELVPQDPADEPASALLERIRAERITDAAKPREKPLKSAPKMKRLTTDDIKRTIQQLPHKEFDFEEISRAVGADYDQLSSLLMKLLDEPTPVLTQKFDKQKKKMRFVRV